MSGESQMSRAALIAAVVAVALVVGGIATLRLFSAGDAEPVGGAGEGPTATTEAGAAQCIEPPEPPSSPKSFGRVPGKGLARDTTWFATLETNCGDIVLELYGDKAPQTVSSFLFLAEEGYWRNSPCHRLVPQGIYVLQCGDPTGTGTGGPGYGFGIENAPPDGQYPRGTLAMARTADPNSNGGQFFLVYDRTSLPIEGGGYSIFGKVVEGMDIVDAIAKDGVGGSHGPEAPKQPISILDVTVEKA